MTRHSLFLIPMTQTLIFILLYIQLNFIHSTNLENIYCLFFALVLLRNFPNKNRSLIGNGGNRDCKTQNHKKTFWRKQPTNAAVYWLLFDNKFEIMIIVTIQRSSIECKTRFIFSPLGWRIMDNKKNLKIYKWG
jgi:hypothetical protein